MLLCTLGKWLSWWAGAVGQQCQRASAGVQLSHPAHTAFSPSPFRAPCAFACAPLQAYISQLKLEGLALTSDMVYVTQSGQCLVHACIYKGLPCGSSGRQGGGCMLLLGNGACFIGWKLSCMLTCCPVLLCLPLLQRAA